MKKLISLILCAAMLASLSVTAFAVSTTAAAAAEDLYALGLFMGTGTDSSGNPIFELDRTPTRHEAITMLVRLLGKESAAKAGSWKMPFTDVADWAKPYVGYAYANGLTTGTGAKTFSGNDPVTATQYLTLVLRALGYDDSKGDFKWNAAWELSDRIGLTRGEYAAASSFVRGDVAIISDSALSVKLNGSSTTLFEYLGVSYPSLSRTEARSLCGQGADAVAKKINTIDDFVDFLRFNEFHFINGDTQYSCGGITWHGNKLAEESLYNVSSNCGGFANLAEYVLAGDYPEMGTINMAFGDGEGHVVSYFLVNGYYYVMDFSNYVNCHMLDEADLHLVKVRSLSELSSHANELRPIGTTSDVMTMAADCGPFIGGLGSCTVLYVPDTYKSSTRILLETPAKGCKVEFVRMPDEAYRYLTDALNFKKPVINASDFYGTDAYSLPSALGGFTLTFDEAAALAKRPLADGAKGVRTVGDLILYLYSGGYVVKNSDCCVNHKAGNIPYQWHFNRNAQCVYDMKGGNCGGFANLARTMLDGDYDEVGIYSLWQDDSGHVMCYVKCSGVYYFLDVNNWAQSKYEPAIVKRMLYEAKSFDEYSNAVSTDPSNPHYGKLVYAVASTGANDVPVDIKGRYVGNEVVRSACIPALYKKGCVYTYGDPKFVSISTSVTNYIENLRSEHGSAYKDI